MILGVSGDGHTHHWQKNFARYFPIMATGNFIDHGWRPIRFSCPLGRGAVRLLLHSHKFSAPFCRFLLARILARIVRTDCGSNRCFGNARSIYTVDFSATQPAQPYRRTFLCRNTSVRVLARLVHRIFARPMYQKEVKLQLAYHCRYAW